MNKTLSIGLAGYSFIIEEHAYIKLSDYLAALRNSLDATEADEVMHDIEIRIVEIFNETLGKREVINDTDVEMMIAKIGAPEVIEEQEQAYYSEGKTNKKSDDKQKIFSGERQLFRDPEKQKIAGVCAGLAQYMGMEITIMRVIWLGIAILGVFTAAISTTLIIIIYVILWIVLPKAQTASDYLKMKGKPVNFDNLKEESNKIVQFANESSQRVGEIYNENRPIISKTGNGLWYAIKYFLGGILALIGFSLLLGSFGVLGAGFTDSSKIHLFENLRFYLQDNNLGYLIVAFSFLSLFIPGLIFSYLAMKLFSPKMRLNNTGYVIGGLSFLWIILIGTIGYSAIKYESLYSGENEDIENIAINTTSDSLMINMKKVIIPANFESYWDDIYSDKKTIYKEDTPYINIIRMDVDKPYLSIKKSADGYNLPLNMKVPVEVNGNTVLLPNYILYPYQYRMRDYDVRYELVVPKNMKVIALNEEKGYRIRDEAADKNNHSYSDSTEISIDEDKIEINGSTIEYNKEDGDSIFVNGKKVPKEVASNLLKNEIKNKINKGEKIDVKIKDGEKEVRFKTN